MDGRILRWRGALDRLVASHVRVERAGADVARLEAELPDGARGFSDVDNLHAFTEDYERHLAALDDARRGLEEVEAGHREASGACDFVPEGATLVHPYGTDVYRIQRLKGPAMLGEERKEEGPSGPGGAPDTRSPGAPNFKITLKGTEAVGGVGDAAGGLASPGAAGARANPAVAEEAFGPPEPTIAERLSGGRPERGPGRRRQRRRALRAASAEGEGPAGPADGGRRSR